MSGLHELKQKYFVKFPDYYDNLYQFFWFPRAGAHRYT